MSGLFAPAADVAAGPDAGPICLYGAGSTGRRILELVRRGGGDVRCFLDAAAGDLGVVSGVPVHVPSPGGEASGLPIVLTVFNRDADVASVARRLARFGYRRLVSYPSYHALHWEALGEHFWLGDPALVGSESKEIDAVERLWADERSRCIFGGLVDFYESRDPERAPPPSPRSEEYQAPDVPGWPPTGPIRLVDCGAYDGDTLESFKTAGIPLESIACFEPDPENFRRLEERLASWPAELRRGVELWPKGVADRTGTFEFELGLGEASRLGASTTGTTIACVSLDEALPHFSPNLLKLDVEGAEEATLLGAHKIIREHRPALAVSVYHRPADLWRLPALIEGWGLGYRLYLRSYGFNGFDSICYAVPGPPSPSR